MGILCEDERMYTSFVFIECKMDTLYIPSLGSADQSPR